MKKLYSNFAIVKKIKNSKMEKIKEIKALKILDSRGDETISVEIFSDNYKASFSVPQGKSTGKYEAVSLPVDEAIRNIQTKIFPVLVEKEINFVKIDELLISLDGTDNKQNLGANAMLAVSIACAKLQAQIENKNLFDFLSEKFITKKLGIPNLLMNFINGGAHSFGGPPFQEYLLVIKTGDFEKNVYLGGQLYRKIKNILKTNIGDEGGFAPYNASLQMPLDILSGTIKQDNLEDSVGLGIDVAANQFFMDGDYKIGQTGFSPEDLKNFYKDLIEKYKIEYLEDPFEENDFNSFSSLVDSDCLIVGDDLTVTNIERLKTAVDQKSISGIIIKPNQIGTLSQTIDTINFANENGIKIIISHRSGETNDSFISDLSVACNAWGLKTGAPARGERVAKYNRLLEINAIKK
jgi:enolase